MSIHEPIEMRFSDMVGEDRHNHQTGWQGFLKTTIDRLSAGAALLVLSPVLLSIALAIRLESKGPVIFRQPRHGKNNSIFYIWKFRTMTVTETGADVRQATIGDERITRLGCFLRRTSIDELPQLVNVLKGDMSLVGPRPHPIKLNDAYAPTISDYWARHLVRPGLTGLAQVEGYRGPTETHDKMRLRVEKDLEYIDRWSIWLDLKVMFKTPLLLISGENAF
jgi:putative colanic acid biosynthesis UDP-glucose lipid carrier transferase